MWRSKEQLNNIIMTMCEREGRWRMYQLFQTSTLYKDFMYNNQVFFTTKTLKLNWGRTEFLLKLSLSPIKFLCNKNCTSIGVIQCIFQQIFSHSHTFTSTKYDQRAFSIVVTTIDIVITDDMSCICGQNPDNNNIILLNFSKGTTLPSINDRVSKLYHV